MRNITDKERWEDTFNQNKVNSTNRRFVKGFSEIIYSICFTFKPSRVSKSYLSPVEYS